MTNIRVIENGWGSEVLEHRPSVNAQAVARLRAEALLDAGSSRKTLENHDLNDRNIISAWRQHQAQREAFADGSERFVGSFDDDGRLNGAIEVVPATDEVLDPFESPLTLLRHRRSIKREANSIAILALLAEKGEGHLDILVDLLRHTTNKYADENRTVFFGVPGGSPAYDVALESGFVHKSKFARRYGVMHTLLSREIGSTTTEVDDLE